MSVRTGAWLECAVLAFFSVVASSQILPQSYTFIKSSAKVLQIEDNAK